MNKKLVSKILGIVSVGILTVGSIAMAAVTEMPRFNMEEYAVKLGSTQKVSILTNLDKTEYENIKNSNPSVITILPNGNFKALNTGATTLSYTFINKDGKEKTIECFIVVSKDDTLYDPQTASIHITLDIGDSTTTIESGQGAIPKYPVVSKDGFILEGWYKDPGYTQKINENERFWKDTTIYAKWVTKEEQEKPLVFNSEFYNDTNDHWAKYNIEAVTYRNLFNGVGDRMFGPEMSMTRGMVITVLGRLDEIEKTGRTTTFVDVPKGAYYEEYVAWGVENGIVTGTSENEFSPNKEITREEMAVMMANYVKYKKYNYELKQINFSDSAQISSWAIESVKILNNLGIMQGNADGTYNPKKVATRAEIATVFCNYIDYINK